MALAIRLARGGAKKRPYYRIVVADSRAPRVLSDVGVLKFNGHDTRTVR